MPRRTYDYRAGRSRRLRLHRYFVYLVRRVPGALVDSLHGVGARCLREAEHHPALRVSPGVLEVDPFLVLNGEVRVVRLSQCLGRNALHRRVNVHELGHNQSPSVRSSVRHLHIGRKAGLIHSVGMR